jgi:hypothetical protein
MVNNGDEPMKHCITSLILVLRSAQSRVLWRAIAVLWPSNLYTLSLTLMARDRYFKVALADA